MKKFRFFLGVIILGSLAIVAVIAWRTVTPPKEKTQPVKETASPADLKLDRVRYTETREGIKEWELEAASAQYFKDESTVILEKVKATFFGKNQETYVLVGEKGRFNTQTRAVEMFGGVELDSSDGYHFRTQSLKYQADKRELSTPDPVEGKGPQIRVEGIGMIVELDRQRLQILSQVNTTLSRVGIDPS